MNKENRIDPWKSFIDENKQEFNQQEPKNLWNAIEEELEPKQRKTIELWKVYRVAAILIVVIGLGFFAMYLNLSDSNTTAVVEPKQEQKVDEFSNDLVEVENFYAAEIDSKLEEVKKLTDDDLAIKEIQQLREEFDLLKAEMGDQINDERIVEALIKNYRLRLELLKEILEELKSSEASFKNTKDETDLI